jgi:hypothetical protein
VRPVPGMHTHYHPRSARMIHLFRSLIRYCKTTKDHLVRQCSHNSRASFQLNLGYSGTFRLGTRRKSRRSIRPASYGEVLFRTMKSSSPSLYTATPRSLFDPQSNSIPRNRFVDTAAKITSTCYFIINHAAPVTS